MGFGRLLLLVLVFGAIVKFAFWIALVIGIAALLVTLWKFVGWLDRWLDARDARRARTRGDLAAIAARADEQNRLFLAGDPRGVYGEYRPHKDFPPVATDRRAEGMKECRRVRGPGGGCNRPGAWPN
jgi:hypothetical protein